MSKQGTPGWFADRTGNFTASRAKDATAKTKSGWSASRAKYRAELVTERLTGKPAGGFRQTPAMEWGTEQEPYARSAYEARTGVLVVEVGYVPHPEINRSGASPDGLVGDDGCLEIKAPESHTHIDTLLSDRIPPQYIKQMTWQIACTGRKWCDFVSFDPRLPEGLSYWSQRFTPSAEDIAKLERDVELFLSEVQELEDKLRERMGE